MTVWLAFVLGGIATYLMRASFITFLGERALPPVLERSLRYVAPAAFAAIVLPATVGQKGMARFGAPDARLITLAVAGLVVWKTRSVPATLIIGMLMLWLLQWLGL
ncbi:MAG: AzlD domain-containing protein [Acidimicrobiales bacterium]